MYFKQFFLSAFLLLLLFFSRVNTASAVYVVDRRVCPADKPISLDIGCYSGQEKEFRDQFPGGLVAVCIINGSIGSRHRSDIPDGIYYKVLVARSGGSSGYVGLVTSPGAVELESIHDDCPYTDKGYYNEYNNGYNSGYNNGYKNGYLAPWEIKSNGYNNGYNNGFNNGFNNGYNNFYNNGYLA